MIKKRKPTVGNVKFRSNIEKEFYLALRKMRIEFDYEPRYDLSGPSVHKNKKVRLISNRGADQVYMTVDFRFIVSGITYIVDCKGARETDRDKSKVKYLLLKHKLLNDGLGETTEIRWIYTKQIHKLCQLAAYAPQEFWAEFLKIKTI
jgi:hypothetical protein